MPNWGKIRRLTRELVAVLVDELGPERAVQILLNAAAEVREGGGRSEQAAAQDQPAAAIPRRRQGR